MLCQFSVKNYRCISEELTLDMQATPITEHLDSLLKYEDEEKFLPLASIYGPNGAGKSTVLMAIYSLIGKVMRPICATLEDNTECSERAKTSISITPYKFSKNANAPTEFEIFFRTPKTEYKYQINVIQEKVDFESLYKKDIKGYRYSEVFTRKRAGNINLRGTLRNYKILELSDTLPLLSYLGIAHKRNSLVKDVINWFETGIIIKNFGNSMNDSIIPIGKSDDEKKLFLQMLKEMDIDISDYREDEVEKKIYTTHVVDNNKYELGLHEESSGTIKLFAILPYIAISLLYGITLIVDELDAKIHPALLQYIISLYSNQKTNKHKAQLIFTSHDLSTMNSDVFRRDEIWFVAKDNMQASKMYSLIEFKTRKDAVYNKQYIEGKYGADPYLQRIINWEEY